MLQNMRGNDDVETLVAEERHVVDTPNVVRPESRVDVHCLNMKPETLPQNDNIKSDPDTYHENT